ncbi:hypothetical protein KALB_86 [Kutzneria albida DSM 43870]|uniref:DUF445 domain-containing protein n=2 Tax=Kutzneria TaxID=43356 RepID=W5VX94_9PSEU|nr:hypothetical protein KALB_86 [Kutzneria albida DSM 43870]
MSWHDLAVYVSMPFIAAVVGYVTKRVAIKMMFEPIEFVGIKPVLGWQGILPKNAERMAATATDTLINNLLSPREVVARLDPERIAREVEQPLLHAVEAITREVMSQYQPDLWEMLPGAAQRLLIRQVQAEAPKIVKNLLAEIIEDIDGVLDIRHMAVTNLSRDKVLLNRLIRDIAKPEFRFIARCGTYFGFALGLVQLGVWALTHQPLIMPLFGLLVGWFTDWLALKMIFFPREPKRYLGLVTWQGLFQKRREQVAADYGDLIAREVITVPNVVEEVLRGPKSDRLFTLIQNEVQRSVDAQTGLVKPFVVAAVGSRRYQEMKVAAAAKAIEHIPAAARSAEHYAEDALDVRNTIVERMTKLSPTEFEGILRPAFRQDEWKLITVGAVIGFLVGELQVLLLLG